jgi:hypothetical protein
MNDDVHLIDLLFIYFFEMLVKDSIEEHHHQSYVLFRCIRLTIISNDISFDVKYLLSLPPFILVVLMQ